MLYVKYGGKVDAICVGQVPALISLIRNGTLVHLFNNSAHLAAVGINSQV